MRARISSTVSSRSSLTTMVAPSRSPAAELGGGVEHPLLDLSAVSPRPRRRCSWTVGRRRGDEDQQRVGLAVDDLLGALDVDLEHHVAVAGRRRGTACRRGCRGTRRTRGTRRRRCGPRTWRGRRTCRRRRPRRAGGRGWSTTGSATGAGRARRGASTTVPLPTPPGPEMTMITVRRRRQASHGSAGEGLEQRARCWSPRPRTRRVSLMPISSMVRRALTLPTPGSDSSTATTFILPTMSSPSACVEQLAAG